MGDGTEPTAWQEITGKVVDLASRSTLPTTSSRTSAEQRISPEDFSAALTPCLSLTGGVGMSRDERRIWLNAAYKALEGFTPADIQNGAAAAMLVADHPSKIVPSIVAAIEREKASRYQPMASIVRPDVRGLPAPGGERPTADEVAQISKRYGVGSFASKRAADPSRPAHVTTNADPDRPCRAPTRADYIRLFGVDPEAQSQGQPA